MADTKISLYYASGSSDKEYHASIEPAKGGFVVNFAYGRRRSILTTGTKTDKPVTEPEAKKILDKLVKEKMAKGYKPGVAGTTYQHTDQDQRQTDILPQLLNEIDEETLQQLIADDRWCAQEKHDGRRVLVRCDAAGIIGVNRRGLTIGLPAPIVEGVRTISEDRNITTSPDWPVPHTFTLDGECIGDALHVFDILMHDDADMRSLPYDERYDVLNAIVQTLSPAIKVSIRACGRGDKQKLLKQLRAEDREGIVFKQRSAPYLAGRPNSGGDQLKFKFTASATCLVTKVNGSKRSVALRLYQDGMGTGVDVGNVTIPANHAIPKPGAIVEIRYLYAYKGGSLYQPVYLGPRDDVDVSACLLSQLKYKPDASVDTDEEEK